MSLGAVLLVGFVGALVVTWLVLAYKEPALKRRNSADFRHQQTENPDWLPGHVGGGQVGG